MAATAAVLAANDAAEEASAPVRPGVPRAATWWREALLVALFYLVYAQVRNSKGRTASHPGQLAAARANAGRIIGVERFFGVFQEQRIQHLVLDHRWIIHAGNVFYATCHFLVTLAVLVWLYRRRPGIYRRWRSVLGLSTALALVAFVLFPTLPPRLLDPGYGFVDTLARYGSLWSFNSGAIEHISDPFAAMPSLHLVWATWCAAAVLAGTTRRSIRLLAGAYPVVTSAVVIVTGNHYILDLVAGSLVFAVALVVCTAVAPAGRRTVATQRPNVASHSCSEAGLNT